MKSLMMVLYGTAVKGGVATASRSKRRQEGGDETAVRECILDAAFDAFMRSGYATTSVPAMPLPPSCNFILNRMTCQLPDAPNRGRGLDFFPPTGITARNLTDLSSCRLFFACLRDAPQFSSLLYANHRQVRRVQQSDLHEQ
jgi:hypothetical protein